MRMIFSECGPQERTAVDERELEQDRRGLLSAEDQKRRRWRRTPKCLEAGQYFRSPWRREDAVASGLLGLIKAFVGHAN